MEIAVEAHMDACIDSKCASDKERKNVCAKLTAGRAKNSEDYLKSQGVKNPMTERRRPSRLRFPAAARPSLPSATRPLLPRPRVPASPVRT